jgi:hypothetical protein
MNTSIEYMSETDKNSSHASSEIQKTFDELIAMWPSSFVSRDQVPEFTGGAISNGRMANLDSLGEGPERFRLGRKIVYPVKPFIEWLIARSLPVERRVR